MQTIQDILRPRFLKRAMYDDVMHSSYVLKDCGVNHGDIVYIICKGGYIANTLDYSTMSIGGISVCIDANSYKEFINKVSLIIKPSIILTDFEDISELLEFGRVLEYKTISKMVSLDLTLRLVYPEDIATIVFTSGTTGIPKPLSYTHKQIMLAANKMSTLFPNVKKSNTISYMPQSALFQRIVNLCSYLLSCNVTHITPKDLIITINRVNPIILFSVPRFYEKLIDQLESNKIENILGKNIKYLVSGSAPISTELLKRYERIGLTIYQGYGLSESSCIVSCTTPTNNKIGSVGKPIQDYEIDDNNQLLIMGELISKDAIGDNYWLENRRLCI